MLDVKIGKMEGTGKKELKLGIKLEKNFGKLNRMDIGRNMKMSRKQLRFLYNFSNFRLTFFQVS